MRKIFVITAVCSLIIFSGCGKNKSVDNDPIENPNLPIAENRIEISLFEELGDPVRNFRLGAATEEIYSCCNFVLLHEREQSGDDIKIDFNGIYVPDICLTALGPASCQIDFGAINNGTYALRFKNEKYSTGQLVVSDESFKIQFSDTTQVVFRNKELLRVPENTLWGWVKYYHEDSIVTANEFIDSLKSLGAVSRNYSVGNYNYYIIDENGHVRHPGDHGSHYIYEYIFEYSGDTTAVHNLLRDFGKRYNNEQSKILISAFNDRGHSFRSWVLGWE